MVRVKADTEFIQRLKQDPEAYAAFVRKTGYTERQPHHNLRATSSHLPVPKLTKKQQDRENRLFTHEPRQETPLQIVKKVEKSYIQQAKRILRTMDAYIEKNRTDYHRVYLKDQQFTIISGNYRSETPQPRPDRSPIIRRPSPDKKFIRRLTVPSYGASRGAERNAVKTGRTTIIRWWEK